VRTRNVWQCVVVCGGGGGCGSRRTTNRRLGTILCANSQCMAMYGGVWWCVVLGEPQTEDSGRLLCAKLAMYGNVWWCVVVVEVVVLGEPHTEDSGRLLCPNSQCMAMCGSDGGCGSRRTTNRTNFCVQCMAMCGGVWWFSVIELLLYVGLQPVC
jgi:hypothetical protein